MNLRSRVRWLCVVLFLLAAQPATLLAESGKGPKSVRAVGGETVIEADRNVTDLLAIDGRVTIAGVVRGHIYAIDAEIVLERSAVVLKSMSVNRGSLTIRKGAVLPPKIDLSSARFTGPEGEKIQEGQKLLLADGATEVSVVEETMSKREAALMKSALSFDRFAPAAHGHIHDLLNWHPKLGLKLKKASANPEVLKVGNIARLTFVSDKVQGSFQRGYAGPRGNVLISAVRFQDENAAEALWEQLEAVSTQVKVKLSVKSALGDGAHWFFRRRNRYTMAWHRGPWFFAVETRLDAEKATVFQQKQFNDQVLMDLQHTLETAESLAHGHPEE